MPHESKVSQGAAAVERSRMRRADRLGARRVLWRESSLERIRSCGRGVVSQDGQGVGVRVTQTSSGERSAGFSGVETCGSVWSCPWCSAKIAAERQEEIALACRVLQQLGRGAVLATFTMRHRRGQSLRSLWDAVTGAWHAVTSGSAWVHDQETYGFPMARTIKTGRRKGETVLTPRLPFIRVVEVTHGAHGWHVHVHALLFTSHAVMDATADELGARLFGRWSAALLRSGHDAVSEAFDCHVVQGDGAELGEYFTKAQYDGPSVVGMEMARADLHQAMAGNLTPFDVLRAVHRDGDAEALAIWREWETGSKGRRQVAWSPGLRALAGASTERTDDEIAADELGGETRVWINPHDWRHKVVRDYARLAPVILLAAEADCDGETLLTLLDQEGIRCRYVPPGAPAGYRAQLEQGTLLIRPAPPTPAGVVVAAPRDERPESWEQHQLPAASAS